MENINIETLVNSFVQATGREGAEKLVNEAILRCGLSQKTFYSKQEFLSICEELKRKGGYVKILATIAASKL